MSTFHRYQSEDRVVSIDKIVTSTWSNNLNNLISAHTSSIQSTTTDSNSQGNFFIEVYNQPTSSVSASVQYSVAYGHKAGSGSVDFTNDSGSFGYSATKVVYNQYRQLVFGSETENFTFSTHTPDDIYIINLERSRYKHNLKTGTLNLVLSGSGATGGTGEEKLHLTDDSITKTGSAILTNIGRQYNIVSGTNGTQLGTSLSQVGGSASYGLFYPDAGFIILNPDAVRFKIGELSSSVSPNTNGNNSQKLYNCMKHGAYFILDSEEKVASQYYFTRIKNSEFNYTTNPSFVDAEGTLNFTSMIDMPRVYVTTVGLYSDNGDLLAVAKLSQPLAKDFTREALVRVKLDY
jgi:hypothetical protein